MKKIMRYSLIGFFIVLSFSVGVYAAPIAQLSLDDFGQLKEVMVYCGVEASNIIDNIECLRGRALNPGVMILDRDIELEIYDSNGDLTDYTARLSRGDKLIGLIHIEG